MFLSGYSVELILLWCAFMPKPEINALIDESIELFSLPDIYFQVTSMMKDPRFSIEDIGHVIAKDPALSVRLLRLVNSPFYGFQSRIDTISRAVVVVGTDDLKNLVLATSVVDSFQQIPSDLVDMTDFWMHSIRCGVIARCLARKSFFLHSERLFLAGLLHDIGSLVLYLKFPRQSAEILRMSDHHREMIPVLQQKLIGFDYAEVGSVLIQNWQLPDSLFEAIACQLQPERALVHKLDAALLALAVYLINALESGISPDQSLTDFDSDNLDLLKLDAESVSAVIEQAETEFEQVFDLIAGNKKIH